MRLAKLVCLAVVGALSCAAFGEQTATESSWIGVWNGTIEGLPGVILTLADDHGRLGGTIVLNGIIGMSAHPQIGLTDTLMVSNPEIKGDTLLFQFTRSNGKEVKTAVRMIHEKQAEMSCLNCYGALTTALEKFVP